MSPTDTFVRKLQALKEGELSVLRAHAGKPLDETLPGFDLFTGLWWPLRQKSPKAPSREASWLVAKLFGAFPVKHSRPEEEHQHPTLAKILGRIEPCDDYGSRRFRARFDALLCSSLSSLEPQLRWALSQVDAAVTRGRVPGLDWVELLDDLWKWDRGGDRDIREQWADQYLTAVNQRKGATHAD
jgi:CRISPR type I-E-associated protein CasB/Cse2